MLTAKTERTVRCRGYLRWRVFQWRAVACWPLPFAWTRSWPIGWQSRQASVPRSARICGPWEADRAELLAREIGYPLFVKPIRAGSSFWHQPGVLAGNARRWRMPLLYDTEVELEEAIDGFEVGCAVLGTKQLTIGGVDEIELSGGFFDYEEKYTLKTSQIHVPARIPAEKAEEIRRTAARLYRALGCGGFARVDIILKSKGEIIFNEVNTVPRLHVT